MQNMTEYIDYIELVNELEKFLLQDAKSLLSNKKQSSLYRLSLLKIIEIKKTLLEIIYQN